MSDIIIGIDLGTTNSLVAYSDERGPRCLHPADRAGDEAHAEESALVPSVVYFAADGARIVGAAARRQAVLHPRETVYSIKRLMGIGWQGVQHELPHLAYKVVPGDGSDIVAVEVRGGKFSPQEISAMILREVKGRADRYFGAGVRKAVITVPAYFDDSQRQATRDAGRIAGLEVLRIVNEPTAAALAYGLGIKNPNGVIAVYDLGGGTFDISILAIEDGVFQVLATHGDTHLGGDDCDREIIGLVMREIRGQFGAGDVALTFPPAARQALRDFAEATKIRLSTDPAAEIAVDLGAGRTYRRTIARGEFETLITPWVDKTMAHCEEALRQAGKNVEDIEQVVMVGGMTRVPLVLRRVAEFFGKTPYTAVNPDEVVALGAAVQASILAGLRRDTLLLDVIPLALGIETMGGAFGKLITAQTRIPCQASEMFTTYVDGQTNVEDARLAGGTGNGGGLPVAGEFRVARHSAPARRPAEDSRDVFGGRQRHSECLRGGGAVGDEGVDPGAAVARVDEGAGRPHDEGIHRACAEDMLEHRLIDLRNQVDLDVRAIAKALARVGARLSAKEQAAIAREVQALRELAQGRDADAIYEALQQLDRRTVRLAELAIGDTLGEA